MPNPNHVDGFSSLPTEIFATLLSYLDLDSIKALRLTSGSLARRCIGPRFLESIQQPVLDVSLENLRSLLALSRNHDLSKKITSLTFLATIMDISGLERDIKNGWYSVDDFKAPTLEETDFNFSPEELSKAKDDLKWLKKQKEGRETESSSDVTGLLQLALENLGDLDSIHLNSAVIRGPKQRRSLKYGEWIPLWTRASKVFSWVTTALAKSQASVKTFDAYQSNRECGLEASNIDRHELTHDPAELVWSCKALESLEMSISGEVQDALDFKRKLEEEDEEDEDDDRIYEEDDQANARKESCTSQENQIELSRKPSFFLRSAPGLRKLELSFRRTAELDLKFKEKYDWIIDSIAREAEFPKLEACTFTGFPAKGESILLFLEKHPGLRSLRIHECHLSSGSWTPIFAYLEQSMPELQHLSFSNLFGRHMQNFKYAQAQELNEDFGRDKREDDWQEGDGLVIWGHTDPSPRWTRYTSTTGSGVHTISFTREEIKKGLVSRPLNPGPGRVKGSAENWRWRKNRLTLYGPLA
ncbi:hypothetical protein AtubIFM61612_003799 [Aspergillus tubingensis]|nr:hypothetical protein AtubIFM61612_003799 [Aspergillus tubingensis]